MQALETFRRPQGRLPGRSHKCFERSSCRDHPFAAIAARFNYSRGLAAEREQSAEVEGPFAATPEDVFRNCRAKKWLAGNRSRLTCLPPTGALSCLLLGERSWALRGRNPTRDNRVRAGKSPAALAATTARAFSSVCISMPCHSSENPIGEARLNTKSLLAAKTRPITLRSE